MIGLLEKMTHIISFIKYLKLKWLKRLLENESVPWKTLVPDILKIDPNIAFQLNSQSLENIGKHIKNKFWKDVIFALAEIQNESHSLEEYLNEDLINLLPLNKMYQGISWKRFGFSKIKDLFSEW